MRRSVDEVRCRSQRNERLWLLNNLKKEDHPGSSIIYYKTGRIYFPLYCAHARMKLFWWSHVHSDDDSAKGAGGGVSSRLKLSKGMGWLLRIDDWPCHIWIEFFQSSSSEL